MQFPVKTFYYKDEQNDEFSGISRGDKHVGADYNYLHENNLLWRAAAFAVYHLFVRPFGCVYCKIKFRLRIVGKQKIKPVAGGGYFLYGNHTQAPGDGFMQALVAFPKKSFVIASRDNVALRGTENLMQMLGALPLPSTAGGYRTFLAAIDRVVGQKRPITIYPEAHIWPYCTIIRRFPATSFSFPVKHGKPCFAFTAVYKKPKRRQTPDIELVVDGPFYPDSSLPAKKSAEKLRDEVFNAMTKRAAESDIEYYRYVKSDAEEAQ